MDDPIAKFFTGNTAAALLRACKSTGINDESTLGALASDKELLTEVATKATQDGFWPELQCGPLVGNDTKKKVNLLKAKSKLEDISTQAKEGTTISPKLLMEIAYERLGSDLSERLILESSHLKIMGKDAAGFCELKLPSGVVGTGLETPDWRETTDGSMVAVKKMTNTRSPTTVAELLRVICKWLIALSIITEKRSILVAGIDYMSRLCWLSNGKNDSEVIDFDLSLRRGLSATAKRLARERNIDYHEAIMVALREVQDQQALTKVITATSVGEQRSFGPNAKRARELGGKGNVCRFYYEDCIAVRTGSCYYKPSQHLNKPSGNGKGKANKGAFGKGKAKGWYGFVGQTSQSDMMGGSAGIGKGSKGDKFEKK
ncbi:hypothetical protein Pmar_PMAR021308 [Perkinsus marinus ATCC 50983]|uniref:Uncharacterized protein n=1 Tax=Perkinsus marinus (strain ATCC 50983 / TXsc) TaxID=423536 RepID=C5LL72_PERM5|nr:hypothetical protein Pmar_PMAR021308 [Perkinsus marinus ATCC 50983]EER02521.1 hypothetical protein Pmar_PMAR021308 [Perkinsus marinus ATCC 50983]|eukprot:XP_002769803.1 hypothetical protein Pmar_PMAR021308 [Perkinsus marinus ATCC 50983]